MNEVLKKWYDSNSDKVAGLAKHIWENPEASEEEFDACRTMSAYLRENGFEVETYHFKDRLKEPDTIIASYGSGHPVIGIMGEYDALPGLGQEVVPYYSPKSGYGHGCGHALMTPAAASAAIALKEAMIAEGIPGTVKFFATPAEEVMLGKICMFRDGAFDGLDCCMSWHPMQQDMVPSEEVLLAMSKLYVEFKGIPAHSAANPENGRSALDAAELMNVGVQYLREHVTDDVRIHYAYDFGGGNPNTVPAYASLNYMVRARRLADVNNVIERIEKIAKGASIMTETSYRITNLATACETFNVAALNEFCYQSSTKIPPIEWEEEDIEYANTLYKSINGKEPEGKVLFGNVSRPTGLQKYKSASTDSGYISRAVPTCRFYGLGIIKGCPLHHWGAVSSVGSSIGQKSVVYASKIMAQCLYDIIRNPEEIEKWKKDLKELTKGTDNYKPVVTEFVKW